MSNIRQILQTETSAQNYIILSKGCKLERGSTYTKNLELIIRLTRVKLFTSGYRTKIKHEYIRSRTGYLLNYRIATTIAIFKHPSFLNTGTK